MAVGHKTGGRQKGTPNKRTAATAKAAALIEAGESPLEFLTNVFRDVDTPLDVRVDAAKSAAPYVHARLSSIDISNKDGQPFVVEIVRFGDDPAPE